MEACLKKTEVKLELLTDIDKLLIIEEGTRGGMCHQIHRHMTNYDKKKK